MPRLIESSWVVTPGAHWRQRGAASLIVVLILFFVVSMVAAYTNRNLIFEQKTAANQQRSSRALEAADAGVEWALTLLNSGRITSSCSNSVSLADTDFRQRYLVIDPATGNITPKKRSDGVTDLYPTCVYNGTNWVCNCPTDAAPVVAAPAGSDIYPAFRVRFRRVCSGDMTLPDTACVTPSQPGVIQIDVNACTRLPGPGDPDCLAFPTPTSMANEGRATVHIVAALRSALPSKPAAALTARGAVTGAPTLGVTNAEATGSGITIQAGGAIDPAIIKLQGKPGSPGAQSLFPNDPKLAALVDLAGPPPRTAGELFFAATFGLWPTTFREQPAAIDFDCTAACSAATLRTKIGLNPGRVFWVRGNLDFDSAGDIGSPTQPVLLNVTGNVTFSSPVNVYGLVYSQNGTWVSSGAGSIFGAAIAQGDFGGTASTDIVYDSAVLTRLRTITGSFVQVPGTWRDFDS